MLEIKNLTARVVDGPTILNGLNLAIPRGEVHAIMGPNGSGKSTLASVLTGKPGYEVTSGTATFAGTDILELEAHERAQLGIFMGFQYPVEIPGVNNSQFLQTSLNIRRKVRGLEPLDAFDFLEFLNTKLKALDLPQEFVTRSLNVGFSGGEKKRNEILQALVLEPEFMILDEIDSGLDIDALQIVARGINSLRQDAQNPESPGCGQLIITHYQRLLNHVKPDVVHVLVGGQIVASGGIELAEQLERDGYEWTTAQQQTGE